VYASSLFGDFICDDYLVIVNNDFIKSVKNLTLLFSRSYLSESLDPLLYKGLPDIGTGETTYRPVATLSYFFSYALFKLHPLGYRLTNILIHIINAILIYLLLNIIFSRPKFSLICAILFGIHPVNAEVLNCAAFRPNSLALLFSLSAIILYFKFKDARDKFKFFYLAVSLFSAVLATFCKEIAVVLPLALILCEYYKTDDNLKQLFLNWRFYVLYFFIDVFYLLVYFFIMPPTQHFFTSASLFNNLIRTFDVLGIYLKEMFFPLNVVLIPPMTIMKSYFRIAFASLAALLSIFVVLRKRRFRKELSFGIFWFFIWLFPMNNFIVSSRILVANRFLYAPLVGFSMVMGTILIDIQESLFLKKTILKYAAVFACFGYFSIFTISTNASWNNDVILSLSVVEKYPLNPYAHIDLAEKWLRKGNDWEALNELNIAMSKGPRDMDTFDVARAYSMSGLIYIKQHAYAKAEERYLQAINLFPRMPYFYVALGGCYGKQGLYEKALQQFELAKKINPSFFIAYIKSGQVYMLMRRYAEAKREFLAALKIYPKSDEAKMYLERIKE